MANEKRLIELETLIDSIDWDNDLQKWTLRGDPEDIDTVDAVEVVHGRCVWCNGDYHTKIMATAIRYHTNGNMDGYELKVNYCPNCGAKMDGDGNG